MTGPGAVRFWSAGRACTVSPSRWCPFRSSTFPPSVVDSADCRQSLSEFLAAFPGAQGYDSFVRSGHEPDSQQAFWRDLDGCGRPQMNWHVAGGRSCDYVEQIMFSKASRPYGSQCYVFPALGRTTKSIPPLMAWWAVSHALSMLARYQPTQWAVTLTWTAIAHAVPLENLLKTTMVRVPALTFDALWQVAQ
jgi:hypothetical protein